MNNGLSRRAFFSGGIKTIIATAALGGLGPAVAGAIEAFERRGGPRMRLSLAAYSFRQYFQTATKAGGTRRAGRPLITLEDFIEYCADQGCDAAELTSYYFPPDFGTDYLVQLKRRAFLRGIEISGSAVRNNFALPKGPERDRQIATVKQWVDHCAVLGAPHIRVFAGPAGQLDLPTAKKLCIEALEECGEYAGRKGVFLGLENHHDLAAESAGLLEIVRAVRSPWVGINLDTGNFHTDDPYADLARCAPYAVNVQYKSQIQRRGRDDKEPADLARVIRILREANYQGYVALEYEAPEDPWDAVPPLLKQLRAALAA
ncbi:MAG: sugar phosphate isomerase/epimerase [Verrucomicrobiae bacterium]|nr:sugar phosphate isomerase/epimerase [Verrucomicrobiae bacterium]